MGAVSNLVLMKFLWFFSSRNLSRGLSVDRHIEEGAKYVYPKA